MYTCSLSEQRPKVKASLAMTVYYMSSQKVEDLRAYKVRTVNQTLDEATGMRKKAWRSTMCEQSDFRILVEDDESESGVIRELIYMVVRFIAWWFTI